MPICGENMAKVEESKPLHQTCAKQENSKCKRSVTTLTKLETVCSLNVSQRKLTKSIKCIVNIDIRNNNTPISFKVETGALVNSFTHILPTWV